MFMFETYVQHVYVNKVKKSRIYVHENIYSTYSSFKIIFYCLFVLAYIVLHRVKQKV